MDPVLIYNHLAQHSLSPEIGVHGIPVDNFSRSGSGGVNLSRLSVGLDLNEPASSKWSSTTSIKFEVRSKLVTFILISTLQSVSWEGM